MSVDFVIPKLTLITKKRDKKCNLYRVSQKKVSNKIFRLWTLCGILDTSRHRFGHFWTVWTLLNTFGQFGHFLTLWTLLDTFGRFWTVLLLLFLGHPVYEGDVRDLSLSNTRVLGDLSLGVPPPSCHHNRGLAHL